MACVRVKIFYPEATQVLEETCVTDTLVNDFDDLDAGVLAREYFYPVLCACGDPACDCSCTTACTDVDPEYAIYEEDIDGLIYPPSRRGALICDVTLVPACEATEGIAYGGIVGEESIGSITILNAIIAQMGSIASEEVVGAQRVWVSVYGVEGPLSATASFSQALARWVHLPAATIAASGAVSQGLARAVFQAAATVAQAATISQANAIVPRYWALGTIDASAIVSQGQLDVVRYQAYGTIAAAGSVSQAAPRMYKPASGQLLAGGNIFDALQLEPVLRKVFRTGATVAQSGSISQAVLRKVFRSTATVAQSGSISQAALRKVFRPTATVAQAGSISQALLLKDLWSPTATITAAGSISQANAVLNP